MLHASSGPNDVVVAISTGEKGDGLVPSFVVGEEAAANSSRGHVVCQRTLVASSLRQNDNRCVVVHPADPELLMFPSLLVGACSLHDVVVHRSFLLGRR
ncbi:hypothetical protein Tco_1167447 [Tanacetum coccineum]